MAPSPTLQTLIDTVRADAAAEDPLAQLGQAARTASEIEDVTDALLGHFVDRCRRAGSSWSEISAVLGVSKQAAHKRYAAPFASAPNFDRFSERARIVLRDAGEQARGLGQRVVGTEHLLLALFEPAEALAAQVLRESGIMRSAVTERIADETASNEDGVTVTGAVPFGSRAVEALRNSVEEALKLGQKSIGTEHLLLALFDDPDSPAARLLQAFGESYEDILSRLQQKLDRTRGPHD
jgi:hypothetical protein